MSLRMGGRPIAAAIVDLDGTLVDTLDDFVAALHGMAAELHLGAVDREFVARSIGKGSEHLVSETLRQLCDDGRAASLFDEAFAAYQRCYGDLNGRHSRVYPGAREGLEALSRSGLRLACLTNKPTRFAEALLRRFDLASFFSCTFGGDAFARKKPDPLPLLETCRALGVTPGQALMVGDSSNDAQAGRAAGCGVVLVTYGYNHGQPVRDVKADAYVDRLDEIAVSLEHGGP